MKYTVKGNRNAARILFDKVSQFTAEALSSGLVSGPTAAIQGRHALVELLGLKSIEFDMNEQGELTATLDKD